MKYIKSFNESVKIHKHNCKCATCLLEKSYAEKEYDYPLTKIAAAKAIDYIKNTKKVNKSFIKRLLSIFNPYK